MSNRPDFRLERPFAELGDKTIIPNRSTISGRADLENGFPLITQQPMAQGGIPPSRTDFNGILYQLSQFCMYYQSGGMWEWHEDTDYDTPAIVFSNGIFYKCLKTNGPKTENVTPPGTDSETWTDINPDLTQNWQEIYDAIARASELYESTQLPVIGTDMDGAFSVAGDTRETIKAGDVVKIGLFRYTVQSASYSEGGKYTTYTVDNPVLASLQGKIVTKRVDYITHITPVNYDMAEVPDGGFSSQNQPNATDNFRVISPAYAVALINYMMREAGSMIGGVDYTGTGFTVASITGDGKSKITINATLAAVLEKIHVGDYLQIVKDTSKIITCVYDITLVNGTPQLMLDKSIADTYVGGTINKGTRAEDEGIIITPGQKIERITVTVTPDTIKQDETAQATAVIYPPDAENQTLAWSVLETNIASIDSSSGLITPVEDGDIGGVTVIGAATDGSGISGFASVDVLKAGLGPTSVIGIVDTGVRADNNGAVLEWIDEDFNIISELPEGFFDDHPAWNFTQQIDGNGDYYTRIPIAYRKRGKVPSGNAYAGNYYEMISPAPKEGFKCSSAFMKNGSTQNHFDISTYRAYNNGGKAGSKPSMTPWTNISHTNAVIACATVGGHMLSISEWQEICLRAVIEKKTFNIMPRTSRGNKALCIYRGIQDFCFKDSLIDREWLQGIRTNENTQLEIWDKNGEKTYINTGKTPKGGAWIESLLEGEYFDDLFIAGSGSPYISDSMIPDFPSNGKPSCVGAFSVAANNAYGGAFTLNLVLAANESKSDTTFRAAKI